ncbi:LOW QUALITY PROTEIN: muscle-specific protein 300 kDa-like [Centruroides vittatus]|uniref:LOW QUALITY PROTEIN: muscle-specific protein 300 kDa-like n=1 Tax=Centruroides vittatus TaxID=120091 RepID=UPI00350F8DEB
MASWHQWQKEGDPPSAGPPRPWGQRIWGEGQVEEQEGPSTAEIVAAQSQDYVDEKEYQYLQTINYLAEEQERVQKKVFTNWINHCFAQVKPPIIVNDLIGDLRDGTKLIVLLEVLSGERLYGERGKRLRRPHFISNINTVLRFLERRRIKLVNINSSDVVDGKPAIVLGLIWTIILHFQIEENTKLLAEQAAYLQLSSTSSVESIGKGSPLPSPGAAQPSVVSVQATAAKQITPAERWRGGARKALLQWVKNSISQRFGIQVNDFGPSWRNGMAFLGIIHRIRPSLVNMDALGSLSNRERLEMAFRIAAADLGIARLLDPEDVDVPQPDEKSIMTYVAQFLHKYPETYASPEMDTIPQKQDDFDILLTWLNQAETILKIVNQPITNYKQEYMQYLKLQREQLSYKELYNNLYQKITSGVISEISLKQKWSLLQHKWQRVNNDLLRWRWKLDSSLPGKLGQIGEWLNQAEQYLSKDMLPAGKEEDMPQIVSMKLEEHKSFFRDLDNIQQTFKQLKVSPEASFVLPEHLQDLSERLDRVSNLASQRLSKLEYEDHKYRILILLSTIETKLKHWNNKLGNQAQVDKMISEYKDFVEKRNVYQEFEKNFADLKRESNNYQKGGTLDFREIETMKKFLSEINEKWKRFSVELRSVGTKLNDAFAHWDQYNANMPSMLSWLDNAEKIINSTEDEKLEFFQDFSSWQNKKELLVQSGEYLCHVCKDIITRDIQKHISEIKNRWDKLYLKVKEYVNAGETLLVRRKFQRELEELQQKLQAIELILGTTVPCTPSELNKYFTELKNLQKEAENCDILYNNITTKVQTIIRTMPQPKVQTLMNLLKKEKEHIVTIKAKISSRLQAIQQILNSQNAWESGINEIYLWLNEAENLISTYVIPDSQQQIATQLGKHKTFFSKTTYYKNMIETKRKIISDIVEQATRSGGIDTSHLQQQMTALSTRFESCVALSQQWEDAMKEAGCRWQKYYDKERALKQWLDNAENIINEPITDHHRLETRKAFLENADGNLLKSFITASEDVLATLPDNAKSSVIETVNNLQERWKTLTKCVSQYLLQQEFKLVEQEFLHHLQEVQRELSSEQQCIDRGEKHEAILNRNKDFFNNGPTIISMQKCLEELQGICNKYHISFPGDSILDNFLQRCQKQYKEATEEVNKMQQKLSKFKDEWKEYCRRFNAMIEWMDEVDKNISAMMKDVSTLSEFEMLKIKFEEICNEVDSHQEDLNWLMKEFNILSSKLSKTETKEEKQRLDALTARYKTLIPEIEATVVVTETVYKCFIYREEVQEVTKWLHQIQEATDSIEKVQYDNRKNLQDAIEQQKILLKQLTDHQSNVQASVQKGRDLQKEPNAPKFIHSDVSQLESTWSEVFSKTAGKLDMLQNIEKLWEQYEESKSEIFKILRLAEETLQDTATKPSSSTLEKSLEVNQDVIDRLKYDSENVLQRLCKLKDDIIKQCPNSRLRLEKETREIESEVRKILKTISERLGYLEQTTRRWTNFNARIEEFMHWLAKAQEILKKIVADDISPKEKIKLSENLFTEIKQKKQTLLTLEHESHELAVDQPNSSTIEEMYSKLVTLRQQLLNLEDTTNVHKQLLHEKLKTMEQIKDFINQGRDEVQRAESYIKGGFPKLNTIQEAKEKRIEIQRFAQRCHSKISELLEKERDMEKEHTDSSMFSDLCDIQDQWQQMLNSSQNWNEQLGKIIDQWEYIAFELNEINKWTSNTEQFIKNQCAAPIHSVDRMEKIKEQYKKITSETSEKQLKLGELLKDCDSIASNLSQKAASELYNQISDLRKRLNEINDNLRQHLMKLSSAINQREELIKKINNFDNWIKDLQQNSNNLNDIFVDQIETVLKKLENLKTESLSKKSEFNIIYNEMKKINETCSPQDSQILTSSYSQISESYQAIENQLDFQQKLFRKLQEFQFWYRDIAEQLKFILQKLEGRPSPSELTTIQSEVETLQKQIDQKTPQAREIEEMMRRCNLTLRDRISSLPVSLIGQLKDAEGLLKRAMLTIQKYKEEMEQIGNQWTEFNQMLESISKWIQSLETRLHEMFPRSQTLEGLTEMLEMLSVMQDEIAQQQNKQLKLHQLGRWLIESDSSAFSTIQTQLTTLDKDWERVTSALKHKEKLLASIISLWKECASLKQQLRSVLQQLQDSLQVPKQPPCDMLQVSNLLDKIKIANELKSQCRSMDVYTQKTKELIEKLSSLNNFDTASLEQEKDDLLKQWHNLSDAVLNRYQNLESQVVLWKQIEAAKEEIMTWLIDICSLMNNQLENFANKQKAETVLEKYKSELPSQQNMHSGLLAKVLALEKLNEMQQIPTLISLRNVVQNHFDEAEKFALQLEKTFGTVSTEEESVRKDAECFSDWLRKMRESVTKCDDTTGDDDTILHRLEGCKRYEIEINDRAHDLKKIETGIHELKHKHPSLDVSQLQKEAAHLQKRYEKLKGQVNKVSSSLFSVLDRRYQSALNEFQRWLATYTEKTAWCNPDLVGDRFSLETKMAALEEVENSMDQGEKKKLLLENTTGAMFQVISPERHQEIQVEIDQVRAEWTAFKQKVTVTKGHLRHTLDLWQKYDQIYENLGSWLRDMEARVKSETSQQLELDGLEQQLSNIKTLKQEISGNQSSLNDLLQLSENINKESPESRVKNQAAQLVSRFQVLEKSLKEFEDKLQSLLQTQKTYEQAKTDLKTWLEVMNQRLESTSDIGKDKSILENNLETLKDLLSKKEHSLVLLNAVTDAGETIYLNLSMTGRDHIRGEMRSLRELWMSKWKKVNEVIKAIETALMAWSTFDDSCNQVIAWLVQVSDQVGSQVKLKPSLSEKKLQFQNLKSVLQDILSHQSIINKLQDKAKPLPETSAVQKAKDLQTQYNDLNSTMKKHIETCENYVNEHETYQQNFEKFQDWLRILKATIDSSFDHNDIDTLKTKLTAIRSVLDAENDGKEKLAELNTELQKILQHTDSSGCSVLTEDLKNLEDDWNSFINQCKINQESLLQTIADHDNFESVLGNLEGWVTTKEGQLRDQPLRNCLETKLQQIDKIKELEKDVCSKEPEIISLSTKIEQVKGETLLTPQMAKLNSRYQSLKNNVKEAVKKWEQYCRDHEFFEVKLAEVEKWLAEPEKELRQLSVLTGDMASLQERKSALEILGDQLSQSNSQIESLIEAGEKLYPHTSPDGREVIRQKLRNIRSRWEALMEGAATALRRLESCLQQLSAFALAQEQLMKWLHDVEQSMDHHTEHRGSLQEKRAQLQSHKVVHQDIISHKPLVENVCEKAEQLATTTADHSLPAYIKGMKQMYEKMCAKSKDLLDKLEAFIHEHQHYLDQCKEFQEWLSNCQQKLQECRDTSGEKKIVKNRLDLLRTLRSQEVEGGKKLADLESYCKQVSTNTSDHGAQLLKREVQDLKDSWSRYLASSSESEHNLENVLQQWDSFEKNFKKSMTWFTDIEAALKQPQLQSTCEEKESQLKIVKELHEQIVGYQKSIDNFTDEAHALMHVSGVETIRGQISQVNSRYQTTLAVIKNLVSRWESIVLEHRQFCQLMADCSSWLSLTENSVTEMKEGGKVEDNLQKIQLLITDKSHGEQLLHKTIQAGERLFQDTTAQGRDSIRQELRCLRDRWDQLSLQLDEIQKLLESYNSVWHSYHETLKQLSNWIDVTERIVKTTENNLTSLQDLDTNLQKYKVLQKESVSHKWQIDSLQEKVSVIEKLQEGKNVPTVLSDLCQRFNTLSDSIKKYLEQLENLSSLVHEYREQKENHNNWQQQILSKLALSSDYTGNIILLQAQLDKLKEIEEQLPQGSILNGKVGEYVKKLVNLVSPYDCDYLEQEQMMIENSHQQILADIEEARRQLQSRIQQWTSYEQKLAALTSYLENAEASVTEFSLKTLLDEKKEQLVKFQDMIGYLENEQQNVEQLYRVAENLEQALLSELQSKEKEFDVLSDESQELMEVSGEMRISMGVSQVMSRFQSLLLTCKELVRKCEQHVDDHIQFEQKCAECEKWIEEKDKHYAEISTLPCGNKEALQTKYGKNKELLQMKSSGLNVINAAVQYGEKLQVGTSPEGWENMQAVIQKLQFAFGKIFEGSTTLDRSLQSMLFLWSEFEELLQRLQQWVENTSKQLENVPKMVCTLEEKKELMRTYRIVLIDIKSHQQAVEDVQVKAEALPDRDSDIDGIILSIVTKQNELQVKAQSCVDFYDDVVSKHDYLSKLVGEIKDWLGEVQNTLVTCTDTSLDRISLHNNLERVKIMLGNFSDEEYKLVQAEEQLASVLEGTEPSGHASLRKELEDLRELWKETQQKTQNTIENLEIMLKQWQEYEERIEEIQLWLKESENALQMIPLQATISEKREQLEKLKCMESEIQAKELEIDAVTDKIQKLHKGSATRRISQLSELGIRYQLLVSNIRDMVSRWNGYVCNHQDFLNQTSECQNKLSEAEQKLKSCEIMEGTLSDLQERLTVVQEITSNKEELFGSVQSTVEQGQLVLSGTAPVGHQQINDIIQELQDKRNLLSSKLVSVKTSLEDWIHIWSDFLHLMKQVTKTVDYLELGLQEASQLQTTWAEKKSQVDRVKSLQHKTAQERIEVDHLKSRAVEMIDSGPESSHTTQAMNVVHKFATLSESINEQVLKNEQNYRDHITYKNLCDDLVAWMRQIREQVPPMTRSLSDRLNLEASVTTLEELMAKKSQGQQKVESMIQAGKTCMKSSSEAGNKLISSDMETLQCDFSNLFTDIQDMKIKLDNICVQLKEFKDEYERVSEWLQLMDGEVKAQRATLKATLEEKESSSKYCKGLLEELEKGKESVEKLTILSQGLLTSHLDTYIRNQLTIINSRYQVILNLAKDVANKIEQNYEQHKNYKQKLNESQTWINKVKETLNIIGKPKGTREEIEEQLIKIQEIIRRQEEGQALVHATLGNGDKTLRSTHPSGKEVITTEMQELQSQWDQLVLAISEAKVSLETALLQWADYRSSEARLVQWIDEHDQKLERIKKIQVSPTFKENATQRRARLRKTNSLVADIESFEPMIQSMSTKAEQLQQTPSSSITEKYKTLAKSAKDYLDQQKSQMDNFQKFMDICNEFNRWLNTAKEKYSKCAQPSGDRDALKSKTKLIKSLQSDLDEGLDKLRQITRYGEIAKGSFVEESEKAMIDEEMAKLQEDYEEFKENVNNIKSALDVSAAKWNEYDEQFSKCSGLLDEMEAKVQSCRILQADLNGKRTKLEEFQGHLQTIFDWQGEFDILNVKAQMLLETYSDSSISNAFTQLSARYNALLSVAKETMHRLEQHFQEHQQQQCMLGECVKIIESSRERLNECKLSEDIDDLNAKLNTIKTLAGNMEQVQNKVRYTLELTDKVILNTDSSGVINIKEDAEKLKNDFDTLVQDISNIRSQITNKISELGEFYKILKQFQAWMQEIEDEINTCNKKETSVLPEKKLLLEKYRNIMKDMENHEKSYLRLESDFKEGIHKNPEIIDLTQKYNDLLNTVKGKIVSLEEEVKKCEQYKVSQAEAENWLRDTKLKLQKCSECVGEKQIVQSRLNEYNKIEKTLPAGHGLVQKALSLGNEIKGVISGQGEEQLSQELEQLNLLWEKVQSLSKEVAKLLDNCLHCWTEFEAVYCKMQEWLSRFEMIVKKALDSPPTQGEEFKHLENLQSLLEEANTNKSKMEEVNELCETLIEVTSYTAVRDKTINLSNRYSLIVTNLNEALSKLQKVLSNQNEFTKAKEEYMQWFEPNKARWEQNKDHKVDQTKLTERLQILKDISSSLSIGQHLMTVACEAGARTLGILPENVQVSVRLDMENMRNEFATFSEQISEAVCLFTSICNRIQEFTRNSKTFKDWLNDIERKLKNNLFTKGDMIEIRTLREHYKQIESDIQQHKPLLAELKNEANELLQKIDEDKMSKELCEFSERLSADEYRCKELLSQLEYEMKNIQNYQQSLQETEKWLLQMSFHLMSHHSQQINNLAQTQDEIQKHGAILNEIQQYQKVIDNVKDKGYHLINNYKDQAPEIEDQIKQQLANIQESYDSLLTSAEQIKAQLEDALRKFMNYEETMNNCSRLLTNVEPQLTSDINYKMLSIDSVKDKLDSTKDILSKLNTAKQQLETAIQGFAEATSSISRPTTPDDGLDTKLNERELQINVQLHDFIEQAESQILALTSIVNEWEDAAQLKENVSKWTAERQIEVSHLQSAPLAMMPEVVNDEIRKLEEMKQDLADKLASIDTLEEKEKSINPEADESFLKEKLKNLDTQLTGLISNWNTHKSTLEELNALAEEINSDLDTSSNKLELIEKSEMEEIKQKQLALQNFLEDTEKINGKLAKLKNKIEEVSKFLSEDHHQKQWDRIRSLEKKLDDLRKRVLRRQQSLELLQTNYDSVSMEMLSTYEWIEEKLVDIQSALHPGFHSKGIEDALKEAKSLQREVENKEVVIHSFEKRVEALLPDLETSEAEKLQDQLKKLKSKFDELCKAVSVEINRLNNLLEKSYEFEKDVSSVKSWLQDKEQEVNRIEPAPGKMEVIEKSIENCQIKRTEIETYEETTITIVIKKGHELEPLCSSEQLQALNRIFNEINDKLNEVKKLLEEKVEALKTILAKQQKYEEKLNSIRHWLQQTEETVSSDLLTTTVLEIVEEQKNTYANLNKEAKNLLGDVSNLQDIANSLYERMKEAEKLLMEDEVQKLKERHHRLEDIIRERLLALEDAVNRQKEQMAKIKESTIQLEEMRSEVKALNRPIGIKVEDAEALLRNCQDLLGRVQDIHNKLEQLKPQAHNADQVQNLLLQFNKIIEAIEDHRKRAKHAITQREQFYASIKEITNIITSCTETITIIEKTEKTTSEKFKKYQNLMDKIVECDAKLTATQDKGEQIGKEGTVADRNEIMNDLQALKDKLNNLRKMVQKLKTEHETMMAEQKKLADNLEELLEKLRRDEAVVKSRPLLSLNVDSVDNEMKKHQALAADMQKRLELAKTLSENIRKELPRVSGNISEMVQENLSELNLLQTTLPRELQERNQYLDTALISRRKYNEAKEGLIQWLDKAEKLIVVPDDGMDYENINTLLSNHKIFFSETNKWEDQLGRLEGLAQKIRPSLQEGQVPFLIQELDTFRGRLERTTTAADKRRAELEKEQLAWQEYNNILEKINKCLKNMKMPEERPATIAAIRVSIQNVSTHFNEVHKNQSLINDMNTKSRALERKANPASRSVISNQVANINKIWQEVLCQLEGQLSTLTDILNQWEIYTEVYLKAQSSISALESKLENMKITQTGNEENLNAVLNEARGLKDQVVDVNTLSSGVLSYLTSSSESAADTVRREVQTLQDRYNKLLSDIEAYIKQVQEEKAVTEALKIDISDLKDGLHKIENEITNLDCYEPDVETLELTLLQTSQCVSDLSQQIKTLSNETKTRYLEKGSSVPEEINKELSSTEIYCEKVSSSMEKKEREFKRARTIRWEYMQGVEKIVEWLQKAQEQLQNKSSSITFAKELVTTLLSELPSMRDLIIFIC